MTFVRYPTPASWPDDLEDREASFDDDLDARWEHIDRLATSSGLIVTEDQALTGGSRVLAFFVLAAAIATICALGVLAHVLFVR